MLGGQVVRAHGAAAAIRVQLRHDLLLLDFLRGPELCLIRWGGQHADLLRHYNGAMWGGYGGKMACSSQSHASEMGYLI